MKKRLFVFFSFILFFLGITNALGNEIVKTEVKNGLYKYDKDINIEWIYYKEYNEVLCLAYSLMTEEIDKDNSHEYKDNLESAIYNFVSYYKNFFYPAKRYQKYKFLKKTTHYNVILKDGKSYIIMEIRFLLK